jgi:hypothetical protein
MLLQATPSIEPQFHYRGFRSPPVGPVQFGALRVKFPFYTRLHSAVRMSTFGSCAVYGIHSTDPSY